jgi:hypothetical protein
MSFAFQLQILQIWSWSKEDFSEIFSDIVAINAEAISKITAYGERATSSVYVGTKMTALSVTALTLLTYISGYAQSRKEKTMDDRVVCSVTPEDLNRILYALDMAMTHSYDTKEHGEYRRIRQELA